MQTKYLVGVAALVSILLASFAGFSLAYFKYQPQIDNMRIELSDMQANNSALQSQITSLNASLNAQNADLRRLENYVGNTSLVSSSSYYVFKQNNTYYARNGVNGTIEYHNRSCTSVIDHALTHVPPGGEVLLKPLALETDAYYVDRTICPPNFTTLASENKMVTICLNSNSNQDVIDLYNVQGVQIRNIRIYGNRMNQTTGNGLMIRSDNQTGTNDLIENVVIDECNGTGIWVQNNALNNAFRNVQVSHSSAYNVQVDSADNQFTNVESSWAELSGFDVRGTNNYFLNCISWGCGGAENESDRNGFCISGGRNMFVGCDADTNEMGGFVLANAYQTMLTSCIGRNNGHGAPGWGFDLYDSIGTVMSACVATDEHTDNKTQDYGFTEGGSSDYNVVTGCNFEGNEIGAVFDLVGIHSAITNTLGYETENFGISNFRYHNITIAVGVNDSYGEPSNFTSSKGTVIDFHVTIKWDNVSINENVTVRVQALMANGTTTTPFEILRNGTGIHGNETQVYVLTEDDISGLWSGWSSGNPIEQLQISAKTTENATVVRVSVFLWGSGS